MENSLVKVMGKHAIIVQILLNEKIEKIYSQFSTYVTALQSLLKITVNNNRFNDRAMSTMSLIVIEDLEHMKSWN